MFLLLYRWNNIVTCQKKIPPAPGTPTVCEKNENYVEFDFRMGTVLVIFSFFWMDNDLVCAPPPPEWYPPLWRHHNYAHTLAHSSKTTGTIFMKLWDIVPNNIRVTNLH